MNKVLYVVVVVVVVVIAGLNQYLENQLQCWPTFSPNSASSLLLMKSPGWTIFF